MQVNKAMILAAGYGKRMLPLTKDTPKPLIKIGMKSLLERSIEILIKLGVNDIRINIFYLADKIESFIKEKNYKKIVDDILENIKSLQLSPSVLEELVQKHYAENKKIISKSKPKIMFFSLAMYFNNILSFKFLVHFLQFSNNDFKSPFLAFISFINFNCFLSEVNLDEAFPIFFFYRKKKNFFLLDNRLQVRFLKLTYLFLLFPHF